MTEISVARTGYGNVFHLYTPGYQPSNKIRAVRDRVAMCNMLIDLDSRVPLADVINKTPPLPLTPYRGGGGGRISPWSWCRACLGHAVGALDIYGPVLELILDVAQQLEEPPP